MDSIKCWLKKGMKKGDKFGRTAETEKKFQQTLF
jgi:hypothetical protein